MSYCSHPKIRINRPPNSISVVALQEPDAENSKLNLSTLRWLMKRVTFFEADHLSRKFPETKNEIFLFFSQSLKYISLDIFIIFVFENNT